MTTQSSGWQTIPINSEVNSDNRLRGIWLWLARMAWVYLLLVSLGLIYANIWDLIRDTRTAWIIGLARSTVTQIVSFESYVILMAVIKLLVTAVYLVASIIIFIRRSDDWMAIFVAMMLTQLTTWLGLGYGLDSAVDFTYPHWLQTIAPWLRHYGVFLSLSLLIPFLFIFPNGRFAERWHLAFVGSILFLFWGSQLVQTFAPGILTEEFGWRFLLLLFLTAFVIGFIVQTHRYRRMLSISEQQQVKWVVVGIGVLVAMWLYEGLAFFFTNETSALHAIGTTLFPISTLALPLALTLAVLRYRLWSVDRVINRSLVYGTLVVLISMFYIVCVGLLGTIVQERSNWLLAVIATGVIAILFQPLHQRMQVAVNRLLYGQRDEPMTVLEQVSQQLAQTTTPDAMLSSLVITVAQTLKLPYVALVNADEETIIASASQPTNPVESMPLYYQGERVGLLKLALRHTNEPFALHEYRLLQEIARRAGATVHAAQLSADLQHSRQQLVTAREEERRRLRRELHDGLGPQLATLSLKIDAARNLLKRDPAQAEQLLSEYKAQTQAALADLRRIVYDLRPPALDQLGLVSALREYAASASSDGLLIEINAPERVPPFPAAVEVALYRIVVEAISNACNHAQASKCDVEISISPSATPAHGQLLNLTVTDNGIGLSENFRSGVGCLSMRERAEELGGNFVVENGIEKGVVVRASLPLLPSD